MNRATVPLKQRTILCILDGWGSRAPAPDNAISQANCPNWRAIIKRWPHSTLEASETFVGLPTGQMGNSEVGHMNIGAGRIVYQDLPRINSAIADGSLAQNPRLLDFVAKLRAKNKENHKAAPAIMGGKAQLFGLLSDGGVHSDQKHLAYLANFLAAQGVEVVLHLATDGRDTPPQSAIGYLQQLTDSLVTSDKITIGTVCGRYYAMDRNQSWARQERATRAIVEAKGNHADSALTAINSAYARGETDEFIAPTVIGDYPGCHHGDGLLITNYRADRVRQLLAALIEPNFSAYAQARRIDWSAVAGMTEYSTELAERMVALFPPVELHDSLGEVVAKAGINQLRLAETEKYAHVTFFFNGGREQPWAGESRVLIPSPAVATYDLKPEMSADLVCDALIQAIKSNDYGLMVVNFANGDMVGHSGLMPAAIAAVEAIDRVLNRLVPAAVEAGAALIITADHGNVEQMLDPVTGKPHTAHSLNPVPILLVNCKEAVAVKSGSLCDLAPTVLSLMGLPQPAAMSGASLVIRTG